MQVRYVASASSAWGKANGFKLQPYKHTDQFKGTLKLEV